MIMGAMDIIEKLQKKPESFRKKLAVLAAIAITAAVLFVWLTALNFFSVRAERQSTALDTSPFSVLVVNFNEDVGFIKEIFSLFKNVSQ